MLKMFYPLNGLRESRFRMGFIWQSFHLLWVRKRILDLSFQRGNPPFWNFEIVLSPDGTLRKQNPMGSIWRLSILLFEKGCLDLSFQWRWSIFLKSWKCFFPEGNLRKQNPMGFIWYSFDLLCLEKDVWHFQFKAEIGLFEILKMFNPPTGLC